MKLVCPKCNLRLSLPDDKIPAGGAWAVCPRCRERFFVNPGALPLENLTRPVSAPSAPNPSGGASRGRDQASRRLLESMKNKQGLKDELPPFDPGLITVYPRPALSASIYRGLGFLLLGLPVAGIIALFLSASRQPPADGPPAPQPVTALSRVNTQGNEESIRKDLITVRRDLANKRRQVVNINYSGPESRVFNYFMGRLVPEICSGIYQLELTPLDSLAGFTAKGLCLEPEGRELKMRVDWAGRYGIITFPDYREIEEVELYPLPEARPEDLAAAESQLGPAMKLR